MQHTQSNTAFFSLNAVSEIVERIKAHILTFLAYTSLFYTTHSSESKVGTVWFERRNEKSLMRNKYIHMLET